MARVAVPVPSLRRPLRTRRSGFSLVELLIVVLFAAILARIALPSYQNLMLRARAASALADMNVVRTAAYAYNTETNRWPDDVNPGVMPPELEPYLEEGFDFDRGLYSLDWEHWILPDGTPQHPETGVLVGVSVVTAEEALGAALEELVGEERLHFTLGSNYTFVMEAL